MRRLLILVTIALLGFAPLGGRVVVAQESFEDEAWDGVTYEDSGVPMEPLNEFLGTSGTPESGTLREELSRAYRFTFESTDPDRHPHIPEIPNAEFMIAIVETGEFVLDVMPPISFVVDPPPGEMINYMDVSGDEWERTYKLNETAFVLDEKGNPCTNLCTIVPPQTPDEFVAIRLTEGYRVIAPSKAVCLWCLFNQYAHKGETTGSILIYPLLPSTTVSPEAFSWIQAYKEEQATARQQPGSVVADPLSHVMAWGYFNPAPNCRGP